MLNDGLRHDLGVSLPLAKRQPVEKPTQFTSGDGNGKLVASRPLDGSTLETTIEQSEAVVIPVKQLQLVALAITEDKQTGAERAKAKAFLNKHGQAVDRLSQIGRSAGQVDLLRMRERQHGELKTEMTSRRSLG